LTFIDDYFKNCVHQLALAVSCPPFASSMDTHLGPPYLDSIPPDPRLSFLPIYPNQWLDIPTIIQCLLWKITLICLILDIPTSLGIRLGP
jgi:hypothetical protein